MNINLQADRDEKGNALAGEKEHESPQGKEAWIWTKSNATSGQIHDEIAQKHQNGPRNNCIETTEPIEHQSSGKSEPDANVEQSS